MHPKEQICNIEGYTAHAAHMSERVRYRRAHPELTAIDKIVIDVLRKKLKKQKKIRLLDAGCGTGERLRMILERGGIDPSLVEAVGVDFCEPLIAEAKEKKIGNERIYENVFVEDLGVLSVDLTFDVVLCLFSVLNNVGKTYEDALRCLAQCLATDGVLVFDFIHPKAAEKLFGEKRPELEEKYGGLGTNEYYYVRDSDGSWGKAYIFSAEHAQQQLKGLGISMEAIYDINTYKTPKGKFAITRPYLVKEEIFVPDTEHYAKTWENSILIVANLTV